MERLRTERPLGLTRAGMRKWGMLFVLLGILGRGILQNRYLGLVNLDNEQLLQALFEKPDAMIFATAALILQFVECCAVPIYCMLLAEGFTHSSHTGKYLLRVLGIALLSEIPFNFVMSARFFDMSTRNPAFGIAVSIVTLYLYEYFRANTFPNILMKILVTFAAFVWCGILKIEGGICCVIITLAFWWFRRKPMFRNLAAGAAAMVSCLFSIFYLAAPMGILVVHFYNGEKGEENRLFSYLFYPAALTLCGIIGYTVFGF